MTEVYSNRNWLDTHFVCEHNIHKQLKLSISPFIKNNYRKLAHGKESKNFRIPSLTPYNFASKKNFDILIPNEYKGTTLLWISITTIILGAYNVSGFIYAKPIYDSLRTKR